MSFYKWILSVLVLSGLGMLMPANLQANPNGQQLFMDKCASCHTTTSQATTGPGLKGVTERRSREWLLSWIRNSQAMVASGDPTAVELFNKFNKVAMTPFPDLADADIDAILGYINDAGKAPAAPAPKADDPNVSLAEPQVKEWTVLSEGFNTLTIVPMIILAIFLAIMLFAQQKIPGLPED